MEHFSSGQFLKGGATATIVVHLREEEQTGRSSSPWNRYGIGRASRMYRFLGERP